MQPGQALKPAIRYIGPYFLVPHGLAGCELDCDEVAADLPEVGLVVLARLLAGQRTCGSPQPSAAAAAEVSKHWNPALVAQLDALQHQALGNCLGDDLSKCALT